MKKHFLPSIAALCLVACTPSQSSSSQLEASQSKPSQSTVRGLWKSTVKADDGIEVPIEVVINNMSVQSNVGHAGLKEGKLSITFKSGAVFLGNFAGPDSPIKGAYIQPGNQIGGQRLAHALDLLPSGNGRWTGTAKPLAREFSIFMNITEAKNKALKAVLLNPERNMTGPVRQYYFTGEEQQELFSLKLPKDGTEFTPVTFDRINEALTMDFGPVKDLQFYPVDPNSAVSKGFTGETQRTRLITPTSDGAWPVGTIEEAGFDRSKLQSLSQHLAGVSGNEGQPKLVHSLLVARGGKLVVEEYYRNQSKNEPHDIRSAGKTFASIIAGALIEDGYPLSADTPINTFISIPNEPDQTPVTLGHLLTHQSGFDCYDGDNASSGGEDTMWQQAHYPNFWEFTSGLPFVAKPGVRYAYCSGGINLAGAAFAGIAEESVLSLLDTRLFKPLGFENAYWNVMPNNEAYLGGGGQLRTRDLLKIGQLYLDDGKWLGQQLIDKDWVAASTRPIAAITPETTGLEKAAFNRFYFGGVDGYAWHLHSITAGDKVYETYEASGNGGQMVVIVPELDLVVGLTGGNYMEGFVWGKWRQEIVGDGIIEALTKTSE